MTRSSRTVRPKSNNEALRGAWVCHSIAHPLAAVHNSAILEQALCGHSREENFQTVFPSTNQRQSFSQFSVVATHSSVIAHSQRVAELGERAGGPLVMANIEQYEHACSRVERVLREMNASFNVRFQTEKRPAVIRFALLDPDGRMVATSGDQSTAHLLSLGKRQLRKLMLQILPR